MAKQVKLRKGLSVKQVQNVPPISLPENSVGELALSTALKNKLLQLEQQLTLLSQSSGQYVAMTQSERDALPYPVEGMMIFNSSKRDVQIYRSGLWQNVGTPAGAITGFSGQIVPDGWLLCDGARNLSRLTYKDLFQAIGLTYGVGVDGGTFAIPDFRGRFLRGAALGAVLDPERALRAALISGTFSVSGGSTVSGSSVVTISSTANLGVGFQVTGSGIPESSVVLEILSSTQFRLGSFSRTEVFASGTGSGVTLTFSNSPVGDFLGSVQGAATQMPLNPFTTGTESNDHTHASNAAPASGYRKLDAIPYPHHLDGLVNSYTNPTTSGRSQSHTHTILGGDPETRPVNLNVNYIIKV